MLERAARCVENARHVYLGTKRKVGSRRILHPNFWRQTIDDTDIPLWCIAFLNSPHSPSRRTKAPGEPAISSSSVHSTPLEFLYPLRCQPITKPCCENSARSRRSKFMHRCYSSMPDELSAGKGQATSGIPVDTDAGSLSKEQALRRVLANDRYQLYDEAWDRYRALALRNSFNSKLLHYLSTSSRPIDAERSKLIFSRIPTARRVERDYLYGAKAALRTGAADDLLIRICLEAKERNQGKSSWDFAISILINRGRWENVIELWENRPASSDGSRSTNVFSPELSRLTTLSVKLSDLITAIERRDHEVNTPCAAEVVKFMLYHVVSNPRRMMDMPLLTMMRLFEKLSIDEFIEARHYYRAISTLQASDIRSANARSILVYRDFRSRMPDERPPTRLLLGTLRMLCAREMSELVEYFLDEYTFFYKKPSNRAYQLALTTFARIGDVSHVENLFERYLAHFGKPSDQAILSPRLYVYARVGNVQETKRLFDSIHTEFGLTPNTVCWNVLLTAHARCDDLDGALSIFKQMPQAGVTPDSYTFGIVMGLLANRGDVDAIFELLDMVKREKIPKTVAMIDTVVEALCNLRRYKEAESVANEAVLLHPPETLTRSFNVLLWNYSFMVDLDSVSRVKDTMLQANIPYDGMTYAALMLGLVLVRKTEAARELFGSLHHSRKLHVTMFHYAILLHGYVRERNRDMVQVLYKEMEDRFGDTSPSSKLAMLKTQIDRDVKRLAETEGDPEEGSADLSHAENFLRIAVQNFDTQTLTTKQPQPGTNKRPFRDAFPSIYYEHLIRAYSSEGAFDKANDIFSEYTQQEYPVGKPTLPTSLLRTLMENYLQQGKHSEVKRCWETILDRTVQFARPVDVKDMVPGNSELGYRPLSIISSYRFMLSRPLSIYMKSLQHQNLYGKIEDLLDKIGRLGFSLTSHNLSLYINILCLSRNPEDQLKAFTLFEGRFAYNFPGWKYIKRGFSRRPEDSPADVDLLDQPVKRGKRHDLLGKSARLAWMKVQPDHMVPTYFTMIHLASAMADFRRRSFHDGGAEMQRLYREASSTYSIVLNTPYLRDRLQGELLRGSRMAYNDDQESTAYPDSKVWTGGVLRATGGPRMDTRPYKEYDENPEREQDEEMDTFAAYENPQHEIETEPRPEPEEMEKASEDHEEVDAFTAYESARREPETDLGPKRDPEEMKKISEDHEEMDAFTAYDNAQHKPETRPKPKPHPEEMEKVVKDDEETDAFTAYENRRPKSQTRSGPEPDPEEMEKIFEDDAEWRRKSADKYRKNSNRSRTEPAFSPEDEWDLRNEDYIDALSSGKGSR